MSLKNTLILFSFLLLQNLTTLVLSCNNIGKGFAKEAAREISEGAVKSAQELQKSLDDTSKKLTDALADGVDATKQVVTELSGSVSELAKSISVKINSDDFENLGKAATENLRDAVDKLSQNWNLSMDTADMKDVGAEAARHLGEALQNINIKLSLIISIAFDDNVVRAVGYASIAGGIAFSVLFIAIVVSLKSCRKCTVSLCTVCVGACRGNQNDNVAVSIEQDVSMTHPPKNNRKGMKNKKDDPRKLLDNNTVNSCEVKVYNDLVEELNATKATRASLKDFGMQKFSNLKNFWSNQE